MLDRDEIDNLFPSDLPEADHWERRYPARCLPPGAHVTRFCPSPTGALHLGGIFVAVLDQAIARQSGGTYLIRIEDTDQERELPGAVDEYDRWLAWWDLLSDEPAEVGRYGPYVQSQRSEIYMTYIRDFLRSGKAYLCFCMKDEIATLAGKQRAAGVPTGYYGRWGHHGAMLRMSWCASVWPPATLTSCAFDRRVRSPVASAIQTSSVARSPRTTIVMT